MMESSGEEGVKQLVTGFEVGMIVLLLVITFCFIAVSSFIPSNVKRKHGYFSFKTGFKNKHNTGKISGGVLLIFLSLLLI